MHGYNGSEVMIKIGLTGGIGSGKSTISSILRSNNFKIIDADLISHHIYDIYPKLLETIKNEFGEQFIDENGKLLRRKLGDYIFKYPKRRKTLESIVLPLIKEEILKQLHEYDRIGEKICIVDAPTLIENNLHEAMDINVLVWTDKATQLVRLIKRDNINEEQAVNRINSQMPLDEKKKLVDFIIDNSSSIEDTKEQVAKLITILNSIDN
jgi:dephospho-CoA kinase